MDDNDSPKINDTNDSEESILDYIFIDSAEDPDAEDSTEDNDSESDTVSYDDNRARIADYYSNFESIVRR